METSPLPFKQTVIQFDNKNDIKNEIRSACQSSINRESLFIYRTLPKNENRQSSEVVVEHYRVKDLKLLKVIRVPVSEKTDQVKKLIAADEKLYLACTNYFSPEHALTENSILIVDLKKRIEKKKKMYSIKEIQLRSYGKVFEIFRDFIITSRGIGTLRLHNRHDGRLLHSIKLHVKVDENRIMAVKIAKGLKIDNKNNKDVLYVRLAQGILHLYNLETRELIGKVKGPKCDFNEEHFEVENGEYLYTYRERVLQRWKFVKSGEMIEINRINSVTSDFPMTFQLDQGIIYIRNHECTEAYDPETFDCLKAGIFRNKINLVKELWKSEVIVNDGIQVYIVNNDNPDTFMQGIFIKNLNEIKESYLLKPKKERGKKLLGTNK